MPETASDDTRSTHRRETGARFVRDVSLLLDRRTDLQGVLGLADLIHDGARWAV